MAGALADGQEPLLFLRTEQPDLSAVRGGLAHACERMVGPPPVLVDGDFQEPPGVGVVKNGNVVMLPVPVLIAFLLSLHPGVMASFHRQLLRGVDHVAPNWYLYFTS